MLNGSRNPHGLSQVQIEYCKLVWDVLCQGEAIPLDTAFADVAGSTTKFNEDRNIVILGADAYPGIAMDANSRMSVLACLAHEKAHFGRFRDGYRRPINLPDILLDEAEASLRAVFSPALSSKDKNDLAEDARDRISKWLSLDVGQQDEN